MVSYFENPLTFTPPRPCRLGHERLTIEYNGEMHLCYPGFPPIGNVHRDSIREAWRSTQAQRVRKDMGECRAPCTMTHNRQLSFAEKARKFYFLMRKGVFR